jgi:hypothetical protein
LKTSTKAAKSPGYPGETSRSRFFDLFYSIDAIKSGRHHPDGVLWLRTGRHTVHPEPVSILDIAPTIYDLIGVGELVDGDGLRGASLVARFDPGAEVERRRVA